MPNLNTKKNLFYLIFISAQILVLVFLSFYYYGILTSGREIKLKIAPVDPRDIFRGDYVIFAYDISTIKNAYIDSQINSGDQVFVFLQNCNCSDDYFEPVYPYMSKFITNNQDSGTVALQAKVLNVFSGENDYDKTINLEYNLEQYYIPERTGIDFDFRNKKALGVINVDKNGKAVLKEILVDDKKWPY